MSSITGRSELLLGVVINSAFRQRLLEFLNLGLGKIGVIAQVKLLQVLELR